MLISALPDTLKCAAGGPAAGRRPTPTQASDRAGGRPARSAPKLRFQSPTESVQSVTRIRVLLVIMPLVDPQGLTAPCFLEPTLLVEIHRSAIGNHRLLVNSLIALQHSSDDLAPDSAALVVWMHRQMGVVHYQVSIRDRVAESDQSLAIPGSDDRMRMPQAVLELLGLLG